MNYNSYGEGWYQFLDILLILIFQEDIYKEKLFLMAVKSKALETGAKKKMNIMVYVFIVLLIFYGKLTS
jgi:hypothetical protein